jgi:DNA-binding HxlR family transcriptional regulator
MPLQEGSYGQYCPISRALDVLGERWSLLIVRDLLCGHNRFNELARGNPRLSRSLLTKRLRQLEAAGIVERLGTDYVLTPAGEELRPLVFGLGEWGAKWQFGDPREHELDAELLMWWAHDRIDFSVLPVRRAVIEFRFRDDSRRFWIVNDSVGSSVCTADPGFDVDLLVTTDVSTLYRVWLGSSDLRDAVRKGAIELGGAPSVVRRVPDLFLLSPLAQVVAATR